MIMNKFSQMKKLILNVNNKCKILDDLDELDKCEQWIGDELLGDGDDKDSIVAEYRGKCVMSRDAVYLCAPNLQ